MGSPGLKFTSKQSVLTSSCQDGLVLLAEIKECHGDAGRALQFFQHQGVNGPLLLQTDGQASCQRSCMLSMTRATYRVL